jgi:hypothetical protein
MKTIRRLPYIAVLLSVLMMPMMALADSREDACQQATQRAIADQSAGCESVCLQALRADKYDYHGGLSAAMTSRAGLEKFAQYVERSSVSASARDEESCHVFALLLKWGDGPFAQSVSHAGPKAKDRVIALLDNASIDDFNKRFPQTFALSKH